jgi:anti-sigma B factor antagonist
MFYDPRAMTISESTRGDVAVLALEGRLDTTGAPDLESHVDRLFAAGRSRIVLDFAAVKFVSSIGLRVIITSAKRATAAGGVLILAAAPPIVSDVFEITNIGRILSIHAAVDAAVAQASGTPAPGQG